MAPSGLTSTELGDLSQQERDMQLVKSKKRATMTCKAYICQAKTANLEIVHLHRCH